MGKGDKKSTRGKRFMGSYGNTRRKSRAKSTYIPSAKPAKKATEGEVAEKKAAPAKKEAKATKATPKKAAAAKTSKATKAAEEKKTAKKADDKKEK